MAVPVCNSWNSLLQSRIILLCSLFFLFTLNYFPLHATALNFNLTNINQTHQNTHIKTDRDASISQLGIEVTEDDPNQGQISKVGRAWYKDPLHLWDKASRNLTDFNTHFSLVIDSDENPIFADGITFFLVPNDTTFSNFGGGSIGLPFDIKEFKNTSSFVAVEFDTNRNVWDPNTTHVGINVNSILSNVTAIWNTNITSGKENEAWISYDSGSKILSVIFTGYINNTKIESTLSWMVDLREYLSEWVIIGFPASTGNYFEKNYVKSWQFHSTLDIDVQVKPSLSPSPNTVTLEKKMDENNKMALVTGLIVGSFVLVGGLALVGLVLWKKSRAQKEQKEFGLEMSMDNEFEAGTGPKRFLYGELFRATNNFAEEQKLGEGGFGGVYSGFSRELNSYIAVKKISKGSKQGVKEYASEVKIISRLRHRNLVQLLGWCHDKKELLLVYEFMVNGSLDYHLFKEKALLTWATRYKIAQGLASALLYLHEEWEQCVVHRDIKSSNVMLDSNFNAKLGDFGLARLVDHGKGSQTTVLAGTMGYMAPECLVTGKASKESDVFSFGIVALEIACGRKPIDLNVPEGQIRMVEWVWDLYGTGKLLEAVDPKICSNFVKEEMECLMIVGLWCAHPDHNIRPSIRQVINVLNFEAPMPILPAKMPVPTYFAPPVNASSLVSLTYGSTTISNRSEVQSSSYSYNTNSSKFTSSSTTSSPSASLLYTSIN